MNRTLTIVVTALAVILIVVLGAVFFLVLSDSLGDGQAQAAATVPATETATMPAATETAALPPPVVTVLPTNTPVPPTDTPAPTETPLPTDTPAATATNTPVPVVIRPTNTPVPPTNTPAPTSPPANTNGLTASHFALQPRAVLSTNQPVWFEFTVTNSTGGPVPFGSLGVMPKKDGQDRRNWYQNSWGGNNDSMPANGLSWEDNIKLPEKGNYTLRLVVCFDGYQSCINGGGTFVTLSQEIPVTIN